mgnify:CR=1 FL=1
MNLARPRRFPGLATLVLAAGIAFSGIASAAGYQHLEIPGSDGQPPVEAIVWSPCAAAAETQQLGPYVVRGIRDCAVSGRSLPLIVVSHGQGGTSLGHHDTAEALADAGFVVVTLNHPGDTFGDDSGAQRLDIFESRPRDVTRVISYMLERWPGAYLFLGMESAMCHHPTYRFDDNLLPVAAAVFDRIVRKRLG